jgi:hypothetical protein
MNPQNHPSSICLLVNHCSHLKKRIKLVKRKKKMKMILSLKIRRHLFTTVMMDYLGYQKKEFQHKEFQVSLELKLLILKIIKLNLYMLLICSVKVY